MKKNIFSILFIFIVFYFPNTIVYADLKSEANSKSCEQLIQEKKLESKENVLFDGAGYDVNCVYYTSFTIIPQGTIEELNSCIILQLAFNKDKSYNLQTSLNSYETYHESVDNNNKGLDEYLKTIPDRCPITINYEIEGLVIKSSAFVVNPNDYAEKYNAVNKQALKHGMSNLFNRGSTYSVPSLIIGDQEPTKYQSCEDAIGEDGVKILKWIKYIFMLAVPIILIVMSSLDLVGAIFSGDENNMKKNQNKFFKRILIAIIIFLAPSVLHQILKIASIIWPSIDAGMCGMF